MCRNLIVQGSNCAKRSRDLIVQGSNCARESRDLTVQGSNCARRSRDPIEQGSNCARESRDLIVPGIQLCQKVQGSNCANVRDPIVPLSPQNLSAQAQKFGISMKEGFIGRPQSVLNTNHH